mmetsp:Transcript_40090/g.82106  ORF Transcript_40090/g.82106 Transcript_40090/m.82106 type:complete len:232 (-) Transcript_40090:2245-2940(-)
MVAPHPGKSRSMAMSCTTTASSCCSAMSSINTSAIVSCAICRAPSNSSHAHWKWPNVSSPFLQNGHSAEASPLLYRATTEAVGNANDLAWSRSRLASGGTSEDDSASPKNRLPLPSLTSDTVLMVLDVLRIFALCREVMKREACLVAFLDHPFQLTTSPSLVTAGGSRRMIVVPSLSHTGSRSSKHPAAAWISASSFPGFPEWALHHANSVLAVRSRSLASRDLRISSCCS